MESGHPNARTVRSPGISCCPIRDLFIRLAQAGLVRAKWTEAIHEERMRRPPQCLQPRLAFLLLLFQKARSASRTISLALL
jgi:hypothetical protein